MGEHYQNEGDTLAPEVTSEFAGIVEAGFTEGEQRALGYKSLQPFTLGELQVTDGPVVMHGSAGAPNEGDTDGGHGGHF